MTNPITVQRSAGLPTCDKDDATFTYSKQVFDSCMSDKRGEDLSNEEDKEKLIAGRAMTCCNQLACSNPVVISELCAPPPEKGDDQKGGHFGMAKIIVVPPGLETYRASRRGRLVFDTRNPDKYYYSQKPPASEEGIM